MPTPTRLNPARPNHSLNLRTLAWLACLVLLPLSPRAIAQSPAPNDSPADTIMAYVGTFSAPLQDVLPTQVDLPPGNGMGIHLFRLDPDSGALTPAGIERMGTSPSCLVVNEARTRLYSTNETDRWKGTKQGSVSAFAIDPQTGQLTHLNTVRSGGAGPTHASIHPNGNHLLVANYFGGSVAVLPILPDGSLGQPSDVQQDAGPIGPTRATNAPPGSFAISGHDHTHAHMIEADPSGQFVLHADLGLDRIYVWKFEDATGTLTPAATSFVTLPPGDGPRHFAFHPNGRWLFSIQEEGSTIVRFDFNAETGSLKPAQTISTLPPEFAGSNFCSEIRVSPDGRFVYAGNRLYDSIAVFAIAAEDGTLTRQSETWTRGDYPRSFQWAPQARYLYSCNQRADNIAIFARDTETGDLTFTGQFVPVGNPSCIVFAPLAATSAP